LFSIGTDIGGTFTDTVVISPSGEVEQFKSPTTPNDVSEGVLATLDLAAQRFGRTVEGLLNEATFAHGTTIATNTLVERTGARTGLLATKGHGDAMLIMLGGTGKTAGLSDEQTKHFSHLTKPEPIIPRRRIVEVTERVDYRGRVVVALSEDEARRAVRELLSRDVDAICIALLWSFTFPEHERMLREIVREESPDTFVSISSELLPRMGEYSRTATTAVNAYVGPRFLTGLSRLGDRLKEAGLQGPPVVMQSNGGSVGLAGALERPVNCISSGPAGGVAACTSSARSLGEPNAIVTDMGGTSFDVGLVVEGTPTMVTETYVDRYTLGVPALFVDSIGAGGGSIASVVDGYLRVGPESAGAFPGPAAYGRGGTRPTVTDANVVLGILPSGAILGGRLKIDRDAAVAALEEHVAGPLGISVEDAAAGIKRIVDSQMADLVRSSTVNRGYDPRDFAVFAFGGAGPAHAYRYAAELGVRKVFIPVTASVFSAHGIAESDLRVIIEHSEPMVSPVSGEGIDDHIDAERIGAILEQLRGEVVTDLQRYGATADDVRATLAIDMRFRLQIHSVSMEMERWEITPDAVQRLAADFRERYEQLYGEGSAFTGAGVEITTFRVTGTASRAVPAATAGGHGEGAAAADGATAPATRSVYAIGDEPVWTEVTVCQHVVPGVEYAGPTIFDLPHTTVVIGEGQSAIADERGTLALSV
jgi:N-methylhydantoinase A